MNPTEAEISSWCVQQLAVILKVPADKIGLSTKFARLGMDSIHMSELVVALEDWLGVQLDPEVALNHPTIEQLAKHLSNPSVQAA